MPIVREILSEGNRIAVWQINETEDELLAGLKSCDDLPKNELRRLERLAVLNTMKYLDLGESYGYLPDGRPALIHNPTNFSISHAGRMIAVASNPERPLGVDIEKVNRNYRGVVRKYLTANEQRFVDVDDLKLLSLIWCVKEAVYKLPWVKPKVFGIEIEVDEIHIIQPKGNCTVRVKNNDTWLNLVSFYEFMDEYCLVWVNQNL